MKKKNQTNNIKKSRKKECILADYSQAKPFERKRELIVQTPNVKIHWPSATKKKAKTLDSENNILFVQKYQR